MLCSVCSQKCKFHFFGFCETCRAEHSRIMETMKDKYYEQYEKCACCLSFSLLSDMFSQANNLLCIRCNFALAKFHFDIRNMEQAKIYCETYTKPWRPIKNTSYPSMLLKSVIYNHGIRKCSDCYAWCENKGSYCKTCKRKHTKDLAPYRKNRKVILDKAGYTCKICFKTKKSKQLALDHDHVTGDFRDVLCLNCNSAIGLMRDNQHRIQCLIDYVRIVREDGDIDVKEDELVTTSIPVMDDIAREMIESIPEEWRDDATRWINTFRKTFSMPDLELHPTSEIVPAPPIVPFLLAEAPEHHIPRTALGLLEELLGRKNSDGL